MARRSRELADAGAVKAGGLALRGGARLVRFPHRHERIPLPEPLEVAGQRFDIVEDLVEYTTLPEAQVHALIRRELEDFRLEWQATPEVLREDTWFYTASRSYLFGNAVHFHESPQVVDILTPLSGEGVRALDFGGGSGNLALALAAFGTQVDFFELSALQKDFVRFRIDKHGLSDRLRVLDRWHPLPAGEYGLITAFDVLEHLPDLCNTVERTLLPSLAETGALAERSPFLRTLSNPMHHPDDDDLDSLLQESGLRLVEDHPLCRIWRRGGAS